MLYDWLTDWLTGPVQCCLFRGDCSQTETPGLSTPRETDRTSSEPNSPLPPSVCHYYLQITFLTNNTTTITTLLVAAAVGESVRQENEMLALVATKLACSLRNILLSCGLYCLHYSYIQSCDLKIMWNWQYITHPANTTRTTTINYVRCDSATGLLFLQSPT